MVRLGRELRELTGLTQEKFAARLGVTFPTVNRWENDRAKPSPLALEKNATTIHPAEMNLVVHGLEGEIPKSITYYEDPGGRSAAGIFRRGWIFGPEPLVHASVLCGI